ncbi:HAD family hydrolase [Actinacidiphila guanduensis]|uniref:Phosphoglycolate phosphatase, HAD superfamily n=1 Tax=Actinacidiphila guanduensis TaxID=310781 RepID=A0A1G9Z5H6_9ACTN|nr:haloacid dehalogenase-like hydrolase [Actinacidiphila guanduensis]SDN16629.1 Phosphoglycolate phosphatase, HAD superfamily [Actinacidiphila guanduensis]
MTDVLVLWDIDRTLMYVGQIDRAVYRAAFRQLTGREATQLPARGTGRTVPLAVRELLATNGVDHHDIEPLAEQMVSLLPHLLTERLQELRDEGQLMDGATEALQAVRASERLLPTVVTGNLQPSAEIKLRAFDLDQYVDVSVGGFSSDDAHRPALVGIAQGRAAARYGGTFDRSNTVIVGDSLEDVRTGIEGGAAVIAVASGTTPRDDLARAGADRVLDSLVHADELLDAIADLTVTRSSKG